MTKTVADLIIDNLTQWGPGTVAQLATYVGSWPQSIRRSLRQLEKAGRVERYHGVTPIWALSVPEIIQVTQVSTIQDIVTAEEGTSNDQPINQNSNPVEA